LVVTPDWDNPDAKCGTVDNTPLILKEFRSYYSWLGANKPSEDAEQVLQTLKDKPIPQAAARGLETPFSRRETRRALRSMAKRKAAGPDKLPAEFYLNFDDLILDRFHEMILEACEEGELPEGLTCRDMIVLYKKGDAREVRNNRPITLLQVDYNFFVKMMVARMKTVVNNFVSKQQLGFVPKRLIGEGTHLLKLLQAYLDETDTEGLILTLDWEKVLDKVSWNYYHQAIEALGFGPKFASWTKMMADTNNPPTWRVKIAGQYSNPFTIKCGVPQGCPFSPLAFLVVAEALMRMVLKAPDIKGLTAYGEEHRISQFADDTQLLLKKL
jgi:hypothetical protein